MLRFPNSLLFAQKITIHFSTEKKNTHFSISLMDQLFVCKNLFVSVLKKPLAYVNVKAKSCHQKHFQGPVNTKLVEGTA